MKVCLVILLTLIVPKPVLYSEEIEESMLISEELSESIFFSEELSIMHYLEYTVSQSEELPDDFSIYDVIVISTPSKTCEKREIERLRTFVESGGGLMLLAEENNKNGSTILLNQISKDFSVTFNIDRIYDDQNFVEENMDWILLTSFPSHLVFQEVASIVYTSGCSLEAEGILVQSSENAYAEKYDGLVTHIKGDFPACMTFLELGKGRIFACGDKEIFDDHLFEKDNALFALNVFDWLAGNPDCIQERLKNRSEISQLISDAEAELESAEEKGLRELDPTTFQTAETLISEAEYLYDSHRYIDSREKADQARGSIREGGKKAQEIVDDRIRAVQECLSSVEKGAQVYLPSQLEAVFYYVNEIEHQETYSQKIEKANEALRLCEEIRTGLEGSARKEISLAKEQLESYKRIFESESHDSAWTFLEQAESSLKLKNYGEAREYAQISQKYSDIAAEEQKRDYVLIGCVLLLVALVVFLVRGWVLEKFLKK